MTSFVDVPLFQQEQHTEKNTASHSARRSNGKVNNRLYLGIYLDACYDLAVVLFGIFVSK